MLDAIVGVLSSLVDSVAGGASGAIAGTAEGAAATTGVADAMNGIIHGASGGMGTAVPAPSVMSSGSIGGTLAQAGAVASDPRGTVAGLVNSGAKQVIGGDTGDTVGKIAGALVNRGSSGGNEMPSAAAPQASPVYSEAAPKQRLADVSQQVHKVEAPPRYYGGFGAAAPIQQQKEQPEPFNMGQYFAGQLSAFRGK